MLSASFKTVSIWIVFVLVGISKVQCRYKGLHCYNSNGFNNMTALEKVPCLEGICIGAGWNLGKCVPLLSIFVKELEFRIFSIACPNFAGIEKKTES